MAKEKNFLEATREGEDEVDIIFLEKQRMKNILISILVLFFKVGRFFFLLILLLEKSNLSSQISTFFREDVCYCRKLHLDRFNWIDLRDAK